MSNLLKDIGQRIRALRKDAKLTQAQLSEKANISVYYMGEIERSEASPSLSTLNDIANALGVAIGEMFPSKQEIPAEVIKDITTMLTVKTPDVEDLILIREMVKRMTANRKDTTNTTDSLK